MRVSIIKPPKSVVSGKAPWQWQVGQTYDLPPSQALVLMVDDCARVEMRTRPGVEEVFFRIDLKTNIQAREEMASPDEEQFYPARERETY